LHKELITDNTCVGREYNAISFDLEKEEEADDFAAEMLMPQKYVEKYLSEKNIFKNRFISDDVIVRDLANKFNVSFFTSITRMRSLGYKVVYL
jgi:Zn-dependent peptidase ImmA (M78 family)